MPGLAPLVPPRVSSIPSWVLCDVPLVACSAALLLCSALLWPPVSRRVRPSAVVVPSLRASGVPLRCSPSPVSPVPLRLHPPAVLSAGAAERASGRPAGPGEASTGGSSSTGKAASATSGNTTTEAHATATDNAPHTARSVQRRPQLQPAVGITPHHRHRDIFVTTQRMSTTLYMRD